jgi:hypothetical protein
MKEIIVPLFDVFGFSAVYPGNRPSPSPLGAAPASASSTPRKGLFRERWQVSNLHPVVQRAQLRSTVTRPG